MAQKTQTYTCLQCDAEWSRPSVRGQVPKWCPDCRELYRMRECARCREVRPIGQGSRNCRECWDEIRPRKSTALVVYVKRPRIHIAVHTKASKRLTAGKCRACDAWFVSTTRTTTCSTECRRAREREWHRNSKDRRRARKKNAYVANVYRKRVYESDGYRCHLCNRRTDPTKQVPHPMAPTIDHVIPLARGGAHEPSNCRTACFMCNSLKSDRGGGEQMLLLAV